MSLLFEIFSFKVYNYGVVMVTAFIISISLALKYLPKKMISQQDLFNFCLIIMASLLLGSKLINMILLGNFNNKEWIYLLKFWERGSFSFFPSILLAFVFLFTYCKLKSIPFFKIMDYLLPFAILCIAIQRIFGCFLAGCCYGKPTNLPWGIIFEDTSRAGRHFPGIPLHPTQLYYGISSVLIIIFLRFYKKKHRQEGIITALGLMMLAVSYLFITFLRGDIPIEDTIFHLNHSQYIAIIFFIASISFIIFQYKIKYKNQKEVL